MSWLNNAYSSILTTKVGIQKVTNYYKYGVFIRLRKNKVTYKIKQNADLLISSPMFGISGNLKFHFTTHPHHEVLVVEFKPQFESSLKLKTKKR